jgi:hypothetical protein
VEKNFNAMGQEEFNRFFDQPKPKKKIKNKTYGGENIIVTSNKTFKYNNKPANNNNNNRPQGDKALDQENQ